MASMTTQNSFMWCQLFFFALENIRYHRHLSFLKFILLLYGDINVNPSPTTVNGNKTPLNSLPFYNCNETTLLSEYKNFDCNKNIGIVNGSFPDKGLEFFKFEYQ